MRRAFAASAPRTRRVFAIACVGLALAALAHRVQAEPVSRPLDLEWSAPASCPDHDEVLRGVDRLLGGAAISPEKKLTARARVEATRGGYRLDLVTTRASGGPSGERTVEAPTCRAVVDAAEVILALAIDPSQAAKVAAAAASAPAVVPSPSDAGVSPEAPAPSVPASSAPSDLRVAGDAGAPPARDAGAAPPPPVAPAPSPPPPPPASSDEPRFALGVGLGGDDGSLPHLAPSIAATFAYLPGALRLALDVAYLPSSEAEVATSPSRGGRLWLFTGAARACYVAIAKAIEVAPCALVEAGVLHGEGFGARVSQSGSAPWFALGAGGYGAVRVTRAFALRLDLAAEVPLARTEFVVVGVGPVHKPAPLVGRGQLGAEVRF